MNTFGAASESAEPLSVGQALWEALTADSGVVSDMPLDEDEEVSLYDAVA